MKLKIALLLCTILLLQGALIPVWAQSLTVKGKVISKNNNEPLPGATVTIKGSNTATITDENGDFTINIPQRGSMLVISYAGMESQEVSAGDGAVAVSLAGITGSLNEVVVVGYGQQRKANVTGSISSIKADQLQTVSNTRLDQALQGRTAGVVVRPTSGQPGAPVNIRIRGTSSNRNSNPLFIVDGIKTGGMESIDPADIASMDILKDAASAAIYGSEGANGVIIITTKTGRRNSSSISYSGQYGVQSVKDGFIDMMNAQQYQQYLEEAKVAGRPTAADVAGIGAGTNWLDESLQTAPQQHHSLTFSGGTDRTTYLVTGNVFTQDGVIGGDKSRFNRYSVRFNGDYKVKSWLNIGNRLAYSNHRRRAISDNNEFGSIISSAVVMDPTTPVRYLPGTTLPTHVQNALAANKPLLRDENGNLYGVSNFLKGEYVNPVARIQETNGENVQNKLIGNVFADIEPFRGFKFTSRIGIDAAFQLQHGWTPTYWFSDESQNTVASGYDVSDNWYTWLWENFATYQRKVGDHNFTILGGTSAQKTHEQHMGGSYSGLFKEEDRFSYADYVPDANDRIGSTAFDVTLASFFGRLTYDYKGRYLFNASVRSDGSSKVAPGYQWKTFPAFSAGWVLSNESFFPTSISRVVSNAKLRASWGQNGSISSVGIGEWMNRIGGGLQYPDASGNLIVGAAPTSLPNPELTWETGEQVDIGADLSFFSNRLNFTVDYYKRTTKDLLTTGTAPSFVGANITTVNAGDVVNKGWEFELSYANMPLRKGDFSYEIGGNLSTLHNEVTYLDPNSPIIFGAGVGTGWSATAMQVGYPIWYFNGYKTSGIFQTQDEINAYLAKTGITGYTPKPGEPIVVDVNGDKQISGADQTMIGSPHPTLSYGGRINLGFKGFDFLMFVQGQSGNDILMGFNRTDRATANKPLFFYNDRWTGPNSTNSWFAPNASNPYIYNGDLMIFNGAYTRIRQLQLGYTLPGSLLNRAKINNARVYVSLDDYFTFTKYPGVDPEGGSNDGNSIGIDRGGYPVPRKLMFGLTFSF
ncbi:SusC/RagA family TonB-linked outer membrane protein [Flavisolibacter tropicus]|uniref:Membrane protein n=1 Tax=Flavisolibacter tropicus TaxID=1492898 RepID=A0A172TUG6_9BACT|nr:TonB-dependent receptor [Flavisolibacter tropicus]ANE50729.1 membrane protein [Flavisolibacter tropicus]